MTVFYGFCLWSASGGPNCFCNEKIGSVVGVQQVTENDQLLVITSDGNIVRMKVNEISVIGRNTQGVRLVGTGESNQVVSVEKLVE